MEVTAKTRYAILSPKKTWGVIRNLRGFSYKKAMESLREMSNKPARFVERLLRSSYFNAIQKNPNISEEDVVVKELWVGQGPVMKRMFPRAQGRADVIRKPTAHITVTLEWKEEN